MLERAAIEARLREMREGPDPELRWDQQCEGSARALVVFVGPSPGSNPNDPTRRRPRGRNWHVALWNRSYTDPLGWSTGFRVSFKPMVEALLRAPYPKASKLIGRANLDWFGNPDSAAVPEKGMRQGAPSVLRMIADCRPELVVPMDKRTFWFLWEFMEKQKFTVEECAVKKFKVRISKATTRRFNRRAYCFRATSPAGHSIVVVKLPQHPAKILQPDYAARCGNAVRETAKQVASGNPVDVSVI